MANTTTTLGAPHTDEEVCSVERTFDEFQLWAMYLDPRDIHEIKELAPQIVDWGFRLHKVYGEVTTAANARARKSAQGILNPLRPTSREPDLLSQLGLKENGK